MSTVTNIYGPQLWADINATDKSDSPAKTAAAGQDDLASKDVFLQLLVAQLKNQNPMSPADGVEFVAQLAQFTELEQSLSMSQDLAAIRDALIPAVDAAGQDTDQP
ncbi:flagellar hook assembly protein FlgD [Paludibaculum fermentans]|uniref:flagellar hook assembly protein FlgD n=1 Tax=Paludibaculum fermentans TaxID=1473598 RepID=UPI003EB79587